jgi:hypothetical protein
MKKISKKGKRSSQKRNWFNLIFVIVVILIVAGGVWFIYQSNKSDDPGFISLKDNWAAMESKAKQWKSDAYLFSVVYETPSDTKLTAKYLAPSVPTYELLITINQSGEVISDPINLGFEAVVSKPIQLQGFSIDSQQAMAIFNQDKTNSKCLKTPNGKKQLSIESDLMGFPAWTLLLIDCPTAGKTNTTHLNAQTGESIEIPSQ